MAYNIQFPNNTNFNHVNYFSPELRRTAVVSSDIISWNSMGADSMYSYFQKITDISPSLCFQSDVFLPNVRAAVQSVSCEIFPDNPGRFVMGCKGHQVQNDFSLEPRIPVAIPLVQYPSFKLGVAIQERDICAVPVLNWEHYIYNLKRVFRSAYKSVACSLGRPVSFYKPPDEDQKLAIKKRRWEEKYENIPIEERPPLEDEGSEDSQSDNDDVSDSDDDEACRAIVTGKQALKRKLFKIDEDLSLTPKEKKLRKKKLELERSTKGKISKQPVKSKSKKQLSAVKLPKKLKQMYESMLRKEKNNEGMIPGASIRNMKNIPELRIEGTWNYLYGGSNGACCVVQNRSGVIDVFVGNRTQLRRIRLKDHPSSTHSYAVESVWEEEISSVPSNVRPGRDEPLSDIVYQVVPNKLNIIGVRRGKSVEIYDNSEDTPYLLDTIPNICYGTRSYDGWKKYSAFDVIKDPLLFGLDFNPQFTPEFITIDENRQIRIGDFHRENTVSTYRLDRLSRHWPNLAEWPKYQSINSACGVNFCRNGHTFITWGDSKVFLGDRRDSSFSRTSLSEIFDARRSTSTLSWSDQKYFNDSKIELNEYLSAITMSQRDFYYYVGTTARLMLMDIRVPGQPVLKTSHGLKAVASQLETYTDDNFEIVVAANQRAPSTFCMITDHAHVVCASRPNCEANNPILQCLPRHLSSSSEFFDAVVKSGLTCQSEADHQRCKSQSNAWTTGISIVKSPVKNNPRLPPGIIVLTSNSFGDLYSQELVQKSASCSRLSTKDEKFNEFVKQWRNSMSSSYLEFMKPSLNRLAPSDNSLIVETCARNVGKMTEIRKNPFNPLTPDDLIHHYVLEHQLDISKQLQQLSVTTSDSDMTKKFFDVWNEDANVNDSAESVVVKQEIVEGDGNIWNEEEESYDIQVLETDAQTEVSRAASLAEARVSSVSSSDSEDLGSSFGADANDSNEENESHHSGQEQTIYSEHETTSSNRDHEETEDVDPLGDVSERQHVRHNDDGKTEPAEMKLDLMSEPDIFDQSHQLEEVLEVSDPFEESKPRLSYNDNENFERVLYRGLPLQDEDENYDSPQQNYLERRSYPDDPLSFGYQDELNDDLPVSSSQTSTQRKPKSLKKSSRSGF